MELFGMGGEDSGIEGYSTGVGELRSSSLKVVSLFAGIGGFDKAFEAVRATVVAQCELDPFCRAVLKKHWPKVSLFDDITKIDPRKLPMADVWTAGFPCQDVSLARGSHGRSGLKGHHTSLFFNLMELVEVKRPRVILLENVVGLLNSHQGRDFAVILRELTKHGYAVSWRVLNARYFGAPQSRSRIFIVAWRGDYQRSIASLFESRRGAKAEHARAGFITSFTDHKTGAVVPEIAYCVAATSGRHTGNDWARSYISYKDRVRRPTASESERLQGFPAGWTIPSDDYPAPAHGLDSDRYRAVGNAVAVPVVRWIADRITSAYGKFEGERVRRGFLIEASLLAPDLRRESETLQFDAIMSEVDKGTFAYRWKGCGAAWANDILEGATATAPSKIAPSRFVDLLDIEIPDRRYFLTANAAIGMLRRADSVGRTLFPPMRAALENMVKGSVPAPQPRHIAREKIAKASIRPPRTIKREHLKRTSTSGARSLPAAD
jgi:DNA (cytosine-5)-methyltransferase 1